MLSFKCFSTFFTPRDKRVITLDTIYTQGRGLPLPFHQYQHLKFIKLEVDLQPVISIGPNSRWEEIILQGIPLNSDDTHP